MKLKGSKIIMECLVEQNVDTIFGYPGGQIMPLYDALYDYRDRIEHILTSHEQGATHAADGYARSTGKVGVCFATSGPGATNTVTGIATAYMDSSPMVVITGQVPLGIIGKDSFQEVDIVGVTMPITKHNFFCRTVEDLAVSVREAFHIAQSGRPGPVLIDVPKNLMVEMGEYEPAPAAVKAPYDSFSLDDAAKVADMINRAEKPVICAGGGIIISGAEKELTALAEKSSIPVTTSLMSMGAISRRNPLSLGMVGMHGEKEANMAVHNADLIVALGIRFSDRVIGDPNNFARGARIVHIDIDQSEIHKNVRVDFSILGNLKDVLEAILPHVKERDRNHWNSIVEGYRRERTEDPQAFLPRNIFRTVNEVVGDDVIAATDVGQHQMWTAQMWPFTAPRQFITSGGLGTMGFGLGAAIGAKVANPDKRVIHITGDGSFRMNFNELVTVSAKGLPIITIVLKNSTLGMVRQWQKLFFDRRYSATDLPDVVDYEKLAGAFGLSGFEVKDLDGLKQALDSAVSSGKAAVIACDISVDENVFPIVPPGQAIQNQVFTEEDV